MTKFIAEPNGKRPADRPGRRTGERLAPAPRHDRHRHFSRLRNARLPAYVPSTGLHGSPPCRPTYGNILGN